MDQKGLCRLCELITFDDLGSIHGYSHHPRAGLLKLEAQRENGCPLCSSLWWSLRYDHLRIQEDVPVRLYLNPPPALCSGPLRQVDVVVTSLDQFEKMGWSRDVGAWHLGPPEHLPEISRGHLTFYGIPGDVAAKFFKYKLVDINPASDLCFRLAESWLECCLQSHGRVCPRNADSILPTRLIDVGAPDGSRSPRLYVPNEDQKAVDDIRGRQRGEYVALSYCWGNTPFETTTSSTIEKMKSSIPMNSLPQTIRDAITITRRLRFRYLWVDALCIIQGINAEAKEDWKRESANMRDIYRGAILTIAAGSASHAYEGIFKPRPIPPIRPCKLKYSLSKTPNITGTVVLGQDFTPTPWDKEPLSRRAWVLQEEILSTRILRYGGSELSWVCKCDSSTESLGESDAATSRFYGRLDHPTTDIASSWKSIVENYSSRDLTIASDRLPALAGLAAMVRESTGDEYLAGLWRSRVCEQLLWKHRGKITEGKTHYTRPHQYRAPSWSWASVDGRIEFCKDHPHENKGVIRCAVRSALPGGLGEVLRGELVLSGHLKKMPTIRCEPTGHYYGCFENYFPWASIPEGARTFLDCIDELPARLKKLAPGRPRELLNVWFFLMDRSAGAGLILLKERGKWGLWRGPFLFRRVGIFEGYRFSEDHPRHTVRII